MQFIFLRVLLKRIKAIRFFMKDKAVPFRKKIIILAGILYLFSPIDLIPAPILIFGVLDDIMLWTFIIWYLKSELDQYWIGPSQVEPAKKFRGKTIIDDVNFEVEKEVVEEEEQK